MPAAKRNVDSSILLVQTVRLVEQYSEESLRSTHSLRLFVARWAPPGLTFTYFGILLGERSGKRGDYRPMLWNRDIQVVAGEINEHPLLGWFTKVPLHMPRLAFRASSSAAT